MNFNFSLRIYLNKLCWFKLVVVNFSDQNIAQNICNINYTGGVSAKNTV